MNHSVAASASDANVSALRQWFQKLHLPALAGGLILGVLSVHIVIARPLMSRVAGMQQNMAEINKQMLLLAGHRDDLVVSNSLLHNLRVQHDQLVEAGRAVEQTRLLQQNVLREARQTTEALAAVRGYAGLQQELISRSAEFQAASDSYDILASLQARVETLAGQTPSRVTAIEAAEAGFDKALTALDRLASVKTQAIGAVENIDAARQSIDSLVALRQSIAAQQSDLASAAQTLDQLIEIKSDIVAKGSDVPAARQTTDSMIAMKDQIVAGGATIDQARQTTDKLVAIQSTLTGGELNLPVAEKNLGSLVGIQNQLKSQTGLIADAVGNLELITDLQAEFNTQTGKLDSLRRGLTEIVMMESALARTIAMIEPLATRVSLRRLDDSEIREVARNVVNRRRTEMVAENSKKDGFEETASDRPVPTPTAE